MECDQPTALYKYMDISCHRIERVECMLRDNKVWFASPLTFNDPFDCRCFFDVRNTREEIVSRKARFLIERKGYSQSDALAEAESEIPSDEDAVERWQTEQIEANSRRTANSGMLCLTPICDNFLMWTHYAGYHRGICIRFCARDVHAEAHLDFIGTAQAVEYVDHCPRINFVRDDSVDIVRKAFFNKANRFHYEREWRIVYYDKGEGLKPIPEGIIDAVILGCQIDPTDAERVINACTAYNGDVEIVRSKLDPESYSLSMELEKTV
ncbi:MAG: DUF2971 domain-containing protein [Planctomycetaceae bacterium]